MSKIAEESSNIQTSTLKVLSNNFPGVKTIKNLNNKDNNDEEPSLYKEIYNKNKLLSNQLQMKENELNNINNLFMDTKEQLDKLNAKHNALMIYASDIQKKNDMLELKLKKSEIYLGKNKSEKSLNKLLWEKEAMISHLESENSHYKEEINSIKDALLSKSIGNNSENKKISELIEKLNGNYLQKLIKLKQIIEKYISYEMTATKNGMNQ